jgi:POT family proton-dependent oligopeptide transporter
MLLATVVFWAGRYTFAHIPAAGPAFLKETFSREGLATLGRIASIFVFVAIFWSLWDQTRAAASG